MSYEVPIPTVLRSPLRSWQSQFAALWLFVRGCEGLMYMYDVVLDYVRLGWTFSHFSLNKLQFDAHRAYE
eukprot:638360-Pyramimonas_sp.AAC.1